MGAAGRRSRATMPVSRSRPVLRRAFERRAALGVGDEEASPRWAGCSGRSRWTIWAASGRRRRARAPNRTLTVHILTGNAPAAGRCQARRVWRIGSSPAGMDSSSTYDRRSRRSTSGSCRPKSGETTRLKCAKSAPSTVGVWSIFARAAARRWESSSFDPVVAAVPAAEGARSLS